MRIALIVPTFPKLSETFIVSKFLGLLARDWDVHVVCARHDQNAWAYFPELQAVNPIDRIHKVWPVRPYPLAVSLLPVAIMHGMVRAPQTNLRYLSEVRRTHGIQAIKNFYLDKALLTLRPDLLHFEFGALALGRMHLREALGCRAVASFRGYDLNHVGLEDDDFYSEVWRKTDALHFLSEALWQRAIERGCPPTKQHALIPPGIDTALFRRGVSSPSGSMPTCESKLRVLSVGRMDWVKGYEYALLAIRKLVDRGVPCRYTIVGDGPYLECLSFTVHQLGLHNEVVFAGAQPPHAVRDHMASADVFLHAAVSEGFCNAVLEAQAMELPVVCSDAGGLGENVVDGKTGFVVSRRNPEALADGLAHLAAHKDVRANMGKAGTERARRHFNVEDQIDRFEAFYRKATTGSSGGDVIHV